MDKLIFERVVVPYHERKNGVVSGLIPMLLRHHHNIINYLVSFNDSVKINSTIFPGSCAKTNAVIEHLGYKIQGR